MLTDGQWDEGGTERDRERERKEMSLFMRTFVAMVKQYVGWNRMEEMGNLGGRRSQLEG